MRFPCGAWLAGLLFFAAGSALAAGTAASILPLSGSTPQSTPTGQNFQLPLAVVVLDSSNNALPGITVTWSAPSTGPSGTFNGHNSVSAVSTNDGRAIPPSFLANATPGSFTVVASTLGAGFQVISASFTLTNLGPPASITPLPGATPQSGPVGVAFGLSLGMVVRDAANNPLPGTSVTCSAPGTGASGTFNGSSAVTITLTTDSAGDIFPLVVANSTPGTYAVIASTFGAGFQVISATFTLTNIGPPAIMTALPGTTPQSIVVGGSVTLGVKVTDAANYPLSGIAVTLTPPASGPSVLLPSGPAYVAVVTSATGIATITTAANNIAGGPYAVIATAGSLIVNFILTNTAATSAPVVTQNPSSTTVAPGAPASFVAAAGGNPTPTVQWQQSTDGGATFTNLAGATSNTLSFTAAASQNGYQYRAIFTNSVSSATTSAAILTVQTAQAAPVVTQNPASTTVAPGATASFVAAASGNPTPTVQWQQSTDGGATFTNIAGATFNTLSFTASASQNGYQYRAVFSNTINSVTNTATTTAAILTVQAATSGAPVITQNPSSLTVAPGATASFSAAATGNPTPTVQWQLSTDGGATFTNIPGATSTTLSFPASLSQNGNQYRAVFSSTANTVTNTATTSSATLNITASPTLRSVNPVIPSFLGNAGFSSNMYVEIYGANLSTTTRLWAGADFNGISAPTSLDGVSVKVNNKPAFVYYISPAQININVPEDSTTGPVTVQVEVSNVLSNSVTVPRSSVSPTLETTPQFNVGGVQYVVALTPDFASFIGRPNLIPGASFITAKPGDNIVIYALGAGPTTPATQAGIIASVNSPLSLPFQLKIGGVVANVPFAGLLANTIGLYQLNVVIPQVPPGDQTIEFIVNGVSNNQSLFITVGP